MLLVAMLIASATPITLDEAWQRVLAQSPRLRGAAADVASAQASAEVAGRWLPDPSFEASGAVGVGDFGVDAELQQSLRWPMETTARIEGARALVDAARRDQSWMQLVAWHAVALAYGDLATAVDQLTVRQALAHIATRVKEAAAARGATGHSAPIDLSFAAVEDAAAQSALFQAEAAVGQAQAALCRELAEDDCSDLVVTWPSLAVPSLTEPELVSVVDARADVEAARKRVASADALSTAAGWQRVPAPTLGVSATQQHSEFELGGSRGVDDSSLLGLRLSVPLPVFSAGQGNAALTAAAVRGSQAEADDVRVRALQQVRAALSTWKQSTRARAAWQDAEPRFTETLAWLADGYVAGAVELDSVLTGRDRVARAQLQAIAARQAELAAAAGVVLALGHLPKASP